MSSRMFGFSAISIYTVPTTQHSSPCRTSSTLSTRLAFSPAIFHAEYQQKALQFVPRIMPKNHLKVFPGLFSFLFYDRFEHSKSQEIHIRILLLVMFLGTFWEVEGAKRVVGGISSRRGRKLLGTIYVSCCKTMKWVGKYLR